MTFEPFRNQFRTVAGFFVFVGVFISSRYLYIAGVLGVVFGWSVN